MRTVRLDLTYEQLTAMREEALLMGAVRERVAGVMADLDAKALAVVAGVPFEVLTTDDAGYPTAIRRVDLDEPDTDQGHG